MIRFRNAAFRLGTAMLVMAAATAYGQGDRRDRREPALVLETGGRTGACDVLAFNRDGSALFAAGDDKVVSIWSHGEKGLDSRSIRTLRWPMWREQRGAIYAMSISSDGSKVAIGGLGMRTTTISVLDRNTGEVLATTFAEEGQKNFLAITALAFSSTGDKLAIGTGDGSVWTWNLTDKAQRIGTHSPVSDRKNSVNWVRLVRFGADGSVVSIAEDGDLKRWTSAGGESLHKLGLARSTVRAASLSADAGWLACSLAGTDGVIAVRRLSDGNNRDIRLNPGQFTRAISLSPDASSLAVGVGSAVRDSRFFIESDESLAIYDLTKDPAVVKRELNHRGRVEALAWFANRLAAAGGDSHEVQLWDLAKGPEPISTIAGAGTGLYGVGFSKSGKFLMFQDHRAATPTHANDRGTGPWKAFDFRRKELTPKSPENEQRVEPIRTMNAWIVEPDGANSYVWYAVDGSNRKHKLPLDRDRDGMPRCYTFLPSKRNEPVRLVVGHYRGMSLFELGDTPARTQLFTGHQGEVTSVAPNADGTMLLSASSDQTISAWSLKPWPSGTKLGTRFDYQPNGIVVGKTDVGAPAWEMGLVPGDRILFVAQGGKPIYKTEPVLKFSAGGREMTLPTGAVGTADIARSALESPEPGKEIFLVWVRDGAEQPIAQLTTLRTRPIWRFFPTRQNDWVMWMWQGGYYDTAANGDYLIGWLMNDPTLEKQPRFFKAEQFRTQFNRDDVIDQLLTDRDIGAALTRAQRGNPVPLNFEGIEPALASIELSSRQAKEPVIAKLTAVSRGANPDQVPQRVELWINDFRWKTWEANGKDFSETVTIEPAQLRGGENKIIMQVFNRLDGRAEVVEKLINPTKPARRRLFGAGVGINDYSSTGFKNPDGSRAIGDLTSAVNDATRQKEEWEKQRGKIFDADNQTMALIVDQNASRESILKQLSDVAERARPDDQLVIFLAGHGDFLKTKDGVGQARSLFVFCGPNYDPNKYATSGIDSDTLFNKLASIRCRKLVIIDACHSGEAAFNPIRALTPHGQGPTILAACARSQKSYENPKLKHGLFTYALLQAMGPKFAQADADGDGSLDVDELFDSVSEQMPLLLKDINVSEYAQSPVRYPLRPEVYPLLKK